MDSIGLVLILIASIVLVTLPFFVLYIKDNKKTNVKLANCNISHELEFGGIYIKIPINEFNKLGFEYGDSVNVFFSNGYKLRDIPYYNGYYAKTGESLLLGYPNSKYVKVAISNGEDMWNRADLDLNNLVAEKNLLWDTFNLSDDATVTVKLAKKGKYLDIQKARDIHYFDERDKYLDDATFANFRAMKGGKLRENYFYRSASPCDNQHRRAFYVDKLIKEAGIKFVINLADDDKKIQSYMQESDFNSPYFQNLYKKDDSNNNFVEPLALNMNFESKYFKTQTIKALCAIINHEGPFLIHCTEGKDRTGFVCLLIESLAGASYDEVVDDYMQTYKNYYFFTQTSDKAKYDIIVENVLNPMIQSMVGKKVKNFESINLAQHAKNFLLKNGMREEQIDVLVSKLKN